METHNNETCAQAYEKLKRIYVNDKETTRLLNKLRPVMNSLNQQHVNTWCDVDKEEFHYECPHCDEELGDNPVFEYCPYCGYAIKW